MSKYGCEHNIMIDLLKVIAALCIFMLHISIFSSSTYGFSFTDRTWFLQTPAWSAVWIFFVLSGYANGKSFYSGKYNLCIKDIRRFYYRRFLKVILPCWIFTLYTLLLVEKDFLHENPNVILKILTLSYYNNPDNVSIGATWYVYSVAWLYILTPVIIWILHPMVPKSDNTKWVLVICIAAFGLFIRFASFKTGIGFQNIYVPFYMNLDLYISGIIIAHMSQSNNGLSNKRIIILFTSLVVLLLINMRIYYKGNTMPTCLLIYQYVFPTVWLIFTSMYIYISQRVVGGYTLKLPQSIEKRISRFSEISFYFYLVHSMIASKIAPIFIGIKSATLSHILLLVFTYAVAFVMSWFMRNGMEFRERE